MNKLPDTFVPAPMDPEEAVYASGLLPRARISCPTGLSNDIEVDILGRDGEYHRVAYMTRVELVAVPDSAIEVRISFILGQLTWDGPVNLIGIQNESSQYLSTLVEAPHT